MGYNSPKWATTEFLKLKHFLLCSLVCMSNQISLKEKSLLVSGEVRSCFHCDLLQWKHERSNAPAGKSCLCVGKKVFCKSFWMSWLTVWQISTMWQGERKREKIRAEKGEPATAMMWSSGDWWYSRECCDLMPTGKISQTKSTGRCR